MLAVLTLERNVKGRDFITTDIHGSFSRLERILRRAHFDSEGDRLIVAGDLIDVGDESERAAEFLDYSWFYCTQSNHHWFFMQNVSPDGDYDPHRIMMNHAAGVGWVRDTPQPVLAKLYSQLAALPYAIEFPSGYGLEGLIHGEVPMGATWQQFKELLTAEEVWAQDCAMDSRVRIREKDESGVEGISRIFCGHSRQQGEPLQLGNVFYMDTGAVFCLLDDGRAEMYLEDAATAISLKVPGYNP